MKLPKIIILLLTILMLTGCENKTLEISSIADHTGLVENSKYGEINMEFSNLDGEDIRSFSSKKGKKYEFNYNYLIKEGNLTIQFRDSEDNIIEEIDISEDEYIKALEQLESENDGPVQLYEFCKTTGIESSDNKIKIALIGDNAKGKIQLTW